MWRSFDLYQERALPQVGSDRLSSPSNHSSGHIGWCSYHCPFCIHPGQQPSHHHLLRNIRGQSLIMGDFNGHNYLWGSHDAGNQGEVIERFTDKHNLCILNDGTHTYLKPQAQHVTNPTSAIELTISNPGLALRSVWEVLPDTHGSDHYPILTSILPSVAEIQPSCDPSHWVFSRADWEKFHDLCLGIKHWGFPRWSRSLKLFRQAHDPGRKWKHSKGNHNPQEIEPLVRWRMPRSLEG